MADFTKEQRANLVEALKNYHRANARAVEAGKISNEALNKLKTCSQATGSSGEIVAQSLQILGGFYIEAVEKGDLVRE